MLPWTVSLIIAAIIIAAVAFYSMKESLPQKEQRPAAMVEEGTEKFRLETPKTPTPAPDFELKDPAGKRFRLGDLKGKVVFLNFWATWCLPCIEEMPSMEKLHQELEKDGLVIWAVNFREGPEPVREFFINHNLTFTPVLDRDGKVAKLYQAWGLPASVIIDKRGDIAARAVGTRDWHGEEALQLFRNLLAEEK